MSDLPMSCQQTGVDTKRSQNLQCLYIHAIIVLALSCPAYFPSSHTLKLSEAIPDLYKAIAPQ